MSNSQGHHHGHGCCGGHHDHHAAPQVSETSTNEHEFWATQPVGLAAALDEAVGAIEAKQKVDGVKKEPYALPEGFEWVTVDLESAEQMEKLYRLLTENYVEDQDALFRFDYSQAFIKWALGLASTQAHAHAQQPGSAGSAAAAAAAGAAASPNDWLVGVQVRTTGKLVGFISAVPGRMRLEEKSVAVAEVNFLCVHKKLRSKRLAPVLIKEVTRRVNLCSIWQAVYTAGVELPVPVASPRYHHRLLNVKKLVEVGFASVPPGSTVARQVRLLKLSSTVAASGGSGSGDQQSALKPMERRHVKQVGSLLREHLKKFKYAPELSNEEVAYWLLPREGVVYTYVKEDSKTQTVTDFASFYALPSQCLKEQTPTRLQAAYMFYTVATSMELKRLMEKTLELAQNVHGFDVFNCLDIMDNGSFLEELKFGRGDGVLNYYVYNYRLPKYRPADIALILL